MLQKYAEYKIKEIDHILPRSSVTQNVGPVHALLPCKAACPGLHLGVPCTLAAHQPFISPLTPHFLPLGQGLLLPHWTHASPGGFPPPTQTYPRLSGG